MRKLSNTHIVVILKSITVHIAKVYIYIMLYEEVEEEEVCMCFVVSMHHILDRSNQRRGCMCVEEKLGRWQRAEAA